MHRDQPPDGSSHRNNTNAARHHVHTNSNTFYSDVATDAERELIVDIYGDYLEQYREKHGDPPRGHKTKLFTIAVNLVKESHAERWAVDRPGEEDSGNALVDAEVHYSESGERFLRHKETTSIKPMMKLSRDTRQWLKELGLMPGSSSSTKVVGLTDLFAELENSDADADGSDLEDSGADE